MAINTIFCCPDANLQNALVAAIAAASDIRPELKSVSESARRAHYAPSTSKVIINVPAEHMRRALGPHSAVIAIEVEYREKAAIAAAEEFAKRGYVAQVHTHLEPEFPDGLLVFVQVPTLKGLVLLFWPRPEDITKGVSVSLPKRVPWTDADHA